MNVREDIKYASPHMTLFRSWSAKENRLIHMGVFGNVKDAIGGSVDENIVTPVKNGDPVKAALFGPLAVAADLALTVPDAAFAGVAGEELGRLPPVSAARVRRDADLIRNHTIDTVGNLLTLHPWEATKSAAKDVLGVVRLPGDMAMDGLNAITGADLNRPGSLSIAA
jgi:hypothetical protein